MPLSRRRFVTASAATAAFGVPAFVRPGAAFSTDPAAPRSIARRIRLGDTGAFAEVKQGLESDYPSVRVSVAEVDGEDALRAECGGMRVFWLFQGRGEVFLPKGYRTQEGGQEPLPEVYTPEAIDLVFAQKLDLLRRGLSTLRAEVAIQVEAILGRATGESYIGDFAAELWALEHVPRPWSGDERMETALVSLFSHYQKVGYSTKKAGGYEPVVAGDQLIACGSEAIPVRGRFACLSVEKIDRTVSHVSTARRLRYLVDTAGGCSFDFDPYRRLPLTWHLDRPGQRGDGVNFVNSHVVNIPRELSSTHFHPFRSEIGGLPQTEIYLVLDPKSQSVESRGRKPSILLFPDLRDLARFEEHSLEPGDLVVIPPGVGHRGLDVFVNVLTVPGFKPHNEFYIDQDIHDRTGGKSPYNENGFTRKNYDRIEDLF